MADEGNIVELKETNTVDVYVVTKSVSGHSSANFANKSDQIQEWILDSGCTFHTTSRKLWLNDFKSVSNGEVPMENNVIFKIKGIGNVTLKFDNGYICPLERGQPEVEDLTQEIHHPDLENYQLTRDWTRRDIRAPTRFGDYVSLVVMSYHDLIFKYTNSYNETVSSKYADSWYNAMNKEMESLKKNNTWVLVPKPKSKSLVECKWIFKVKEGISQKDSMKFKARLVAKGFTQKCKVPCANAVGSVMYTMVYTRPDVAHAISTLSRFMVNLSHEHWEALKWLLRYLKGTSNFGLIYGTCNEGAILKGFVDADFASDKVNRKSTTAYVFTLCGTCISWKSQFPPIVALSTTESEYVAATEEIKEGLWLKGLLSEINVLS
ncbi:Retrovirus-related Pol polyprotein from transposon TNT 1-94 [Abeliophyllum distichum]|uniref:Retrovirus-related Pol polyprotein from transposon TNT 1-94 n=1 Tax=Abeliophyllum distichum TaxID=126358 RepID=A0ABD1V7N7_9LAMI